MQNRNTFAHFLHDAGLAAWFGGSLMGAIGLNGAAADVDDPRQRARVANAGWGRWTPVNLVAIGAHLVGGAQLMKENKGRVATQKGVLANTNAKLALTAGALGATAYSRILGQKVMNAGDVPVAGGTASLPSTTQYDERPATARCAGRSACPTTLRPRPPRPPRGATQVPQHCDTWPASP